MRRCFGTLVLLGSAGNNVVFQANDLSFTGSTTVGSLKQMYVSDGTAAGTVPVGSISYTGGLVSFGAEAIFDGSDANGDAGLWVTDGTVSGTKFVTAATSVLSPEDTNGYGAALNATQAMFIDPSGNLWITDGTAAGTHAVPFSGEPVAVGEMWSFNGKVVFGGAGALYISDGTSAGTYQLFGQNVNPGELFAGSFVQLSPTMGLIFGDGIWRTDGTTAGTVKLAFSPSSSLLEAAALGQTGKAVFTDGVTLYETDGNTVTSIASVASAMDMITFNNDVWFMAENGSGQYVQWVTDGTAAGTQPVTAAGLLDVHATAGEGPYAAALSGAAPTPTPTPTPTAMPPWLPPAGTTNNFAVTDQSTTGSYAGGSWQSEGTPYSGPVAGLTSELIAVTSDNINITAETPNVFISADGGSGEDAIAVNHANGNNVLNGSTGSSFLYGGTGNDTFFVDDRNPPAGSSIWSTVVGFHSGDAATIWGVTPSDFTLSWVDGQGATGYTGLTLHATAPGVPTASLTLAGFTSADLTDGKLTVSYGTTAASGGVPGSTYMYVHGT